MISITSLQEYLQGDNVFGEKKALTLMGVPGSGINTVLKDFAFMQDNARYVYIDLKNIGNITEYNAMRHIARSFILSLSTRLGLKVKESVIDYTDYYSILDSLIGVLVEANINMELVIVLDNFQYILDLDGYFFESLRRLKEIRLGGEEKSMEMIFSLDCYLHPESVIEKFGDFYEYIFGAVEFVNGFATEEITDVLQPITKRNRELSKRILSWSGGNPKLVDSILDWLGKRLEIDPELSQIDDYEEVLVRDLLVRSFLLRIWNSLTENQRKILVEEGSLEKWTFEYKYLLGTKLITGLGEGGIKSNLSLMKLVEVNNPPVKEPVAPARNDKVVLVAPDREMVLNTDKLSSQEFKVYDLLEKNRGKIISKEDISKVIWGSKKSGRKKAWAIDQLMKRVRSKIGDESNEIIQTVRGRGYRYQK